MIEREPEHPVYREFKLFTGGKERGIDAIAIMSELMKEMDENERRAALFYVADKFGFVELGQTVLRRLPVTTKGDRDE
jgi:hypothetical protein